MFVRFGEEVKRPRVADFVEEGFPRATGGEVLEIGEFMADGVQGYVWIV